MRVPKAMELLQTMDKLAYHGYHKFHPFILISDLSLPMIKRGASIRHEDFSHSIVIAYCIAKQLR